ncbi:hypothetical protein E2C01_054741 [Portunus trituberculatus]|uniref:Uncharacterized protein n=1 Tax=Portunus trituberculatus TaxID=210409 RepID=A0A5B7GTI5_PORTR|nr:hypothetical protein [Portunus trituberculatus]
MLSESNVHFGYSSCLLHAGNTEQGVGVDVGVGVGVGVDVAANEFYHETLLPPARTSQLAKVTRVFKFIFFYGYSERLNISTLSTGEILKRSRLIISVGLENSRVSIFM